MNRRLKVVLLALSVATAGLAYQSFNQSVVGQQRVTASPRVGEGLNTTVFQTPAGKINVNLPEDLAAGDTLTGTVIAEPSGKTPDEIAMASDELNGYVVEIKKAEEPPPKEGPKPAKPKPPCTTPSQPNIACLLPPAVRVIDVCLTRGGKPVCQAPVPVASTPPTDCPGPQECTMPSVGQCGRPISIRTPCDGSFANSGVQVGNQPCTMLAEGPRGMVCQSPRNVVGPTNITMNEGGRTATAPFANLAVKLSSPKTTLKKGESTTVTVKVYGLQGIKTPVKLRIQNRTPNTIDMDGGNDQTITINPQS